MAAEQEIPTLEVDSQRLREKLVRDGVLPEPRPDPIGRQ